MVTGEGDYARLGCIGNAILCQLMVYPNISGCLHICDGLHQLKFPGFTVDCKT